MRKMIDCEAALAAVKELARPCPPVEVALADALGLILAEPVVADRDYPPFTRAMMDGYAVRSDAAGRTLPVRGEVAAGGPAPAPLPPAACVEIMTGAPCPEGTEVVVPKEEVHCDHGQITFPAELHPGDNLVPRGRELSAGTALLSPGTSLGAGALAVLAAVGRSRVRVHRRPRLAILSTGTELCAVDQPVGPTQIRDSNTVMLGAMARSVGVTELATHHAPDEPGRLLGVLEAAAGADLIVLSGGVSAGRYDLVPAALEAFGATPVFHKVTQKPGKPLLFAHKSEQLIFGLPGTPLGSHLGFHRYVRSAIRQMLGYPASAAPRLTGTLAEPLGVTGERVKFVLCRAAPSAEGWLLRPCPSSSSDLFAPRLANAYLQVPAGDHHLAAGSAIEFEWATGAEETVR